MMLFRKNDAVLDFDLAKVIEQSKDNAVFYVQYCLMAAICSILPPLRANLIELPFFWKKWRQRSTLCGTGARTSLI
jgi:arginyl-tRNA synthetase